METIAVIDKILQNAIVRWVSAGLVIALSVLVTVQTVRFKTTKMELNSAKGQNAEYAAKLTTQNDAIKKASDDAHTMRLQAQAANAHVAELQTKLKQRKVEIREVVLQGDCPNMVQQVLDEVRK